MLTRALVFDALFSKAVTIWVATVTASRAYASFDVPPAKFHYLLIS